MLRGGSTKFIPLTTLGPAWSHRPQVNVWCIKSGRQEELTLVQHIGS